ncbi:MAG: hypothetical protein LC800_03445, partial [Acidobacteria bacterium]|nr:hypothetical protein [Acidobacteriota bacterium]
MREFVRRLCEHVEFTDDAGGPADLDSLVEALRGYAETAYPSSPPDYVEDSPPFALRVPSGLRCDFLRAAFRVWVTELRPRFRPDLPGAHCSCAGAEGAAQGGDADCVLLAELRVYLTPDTLVDDAREVRLVEAQRPVLVHQRMLQEFLLCGSCCACGGGGGVASPPDAPAPPADLALDDLSDVDAPAPQPDYLLTFSGGQWVAAPPPAAPPAAARPLLPFVTVTESSSETGNAFLLWFHLDAPKNGAEIIGLSADEMKVFTENADPTADFFEEVTILDLTPVAGARNVFRCEIKKSRSPLYR